MRNASALLFALVALSSCTNSLGSDEDEERISGLYILERVDGALVPALIAPQQGCNRTVSEGILTISSRGPDVQPMYDWRFAIETDCQPVPSGVFQGTDDVGVWSFQSAQLSFRSLKAHGAYTAGLEEPSGSPPAVTLVHLGNSYRFIRLMRWDDPQGAVFVKFVDQAGQPVAGVVVRFTFANGLRGAGTTPSTGEFGATGIVGECNISFTLPAGYEASTSQSNPFSVVVVQGPPIRVEIPLTKTG